VLASAALLAELEPAASLPDTRARAGKRDRALDLKVLSTPGEPPQDAAAGR
jgi:hypothetical protein